MKSNIDVLEEQEEYLGAKIPDKLRYRIEETVVNLYCELGICAVPVDPFDITNKKGYFITKSSQLPLGTLGLLGLRRLDGGSWFNTSSRNFEICYKDNQIYTRQRFTVMHEIGHITLKHTQSCDLSEKSADYFAQYALAPLPLVRKFGCKTFNDIVDIFNVSQESAKIVFKMYIKEKQKRRPFRTYEKKLLKLFEY